MFIALVPVAVSVMHIRVMDMLMAVHLMLVKMCMPAGSFSFQMDVVMMTIVMAMHVDMLLSQMGMEM
jgi:hypothetical protein